MHYSRFSFVNKFLCNNGERIKLSLKCHDGKTVIDLQLHLQFIPPPAPYHPQSPPPRVHPTPSRVRRTARRPHSRAAIKCIRNRSKFLLPVLVFILIQLKSQLNKLKRMLLFTENVLRVLVCNYAIVTKDSNKLGLSCAKLSTASASYPLAVALYMESEW